MPHKTGRMLPEGHAFFSRVVKLDPGERDLRLQTFWRTNGSTLMFDGS